MWFYTGKGDGGKTTLFNGKQIAKDDPILELVGSIDELNAFIGFAISKADKTEYKYDLQSLQGYLSKAMGFLASASEPYLFDFDLTDILEWMESRMLFYSEGVIKPKKFTFSGKNELSAIFDICRTISRRIERLAVKMFSGTESVENQILVFLNRLSSYFYILRLHFEK